MKLTKETIQQLGESGIYDALEDERKSVFSTYSYAISEKDVNSMALEIIKQKIAGFNNDVDNFNENFQQKLEKRIKAKIKIALSNKNDPDKAYEIITKYIEGRFKSPQSYRQAERSFDRLNSFFERNEYETSSLLFEMLLKNNDVFRENVRFIINEKASTILEQILTQELKNRKYTICDNKTLNQAIRKYIGVYEGNLEAELNALVQSKPASNIKIKIRISPTGYNSAKQQPQSKGTTTNNTTVKPNDSKKAEGRSQQVVKSMSPKNTTPTNPTKTGAQRSSKSFYDSQGKDGENPTRQYQSQITHPDTTAEPQKVLINTPLANSFAFQAQKQKDKEENKVPDESKGTQTPEEVIKPATDAIIEVTEESGETAQEPETKAVTISDTSAETNKEKSEVPDEPEITQASEEVIEQATDAIVTEESGETAQEPETKTVTISDTTNETNKEKSEVSDEPEDTQTSEEVIEQAGTPVPDAITEVPEESGETAQESETKAVTISDARTTEIEETPEEETATKVEPENNSSIEASLDKETIVSEDQATEEGTNKEASSNAITKEEQGSTAPKRRKYVKYNSNSLYQLIGSDKEYANTKTDIIINTLTNEEQDFINRLFTNGLDNPPADKISGKDKNKIVTIVGKIRRRIESNDTLIDIIISELPPEKMELITKYGNGTITDEDKEKYKNLTFEISEKLNKINPFYDLIDPKKEYTQEEYDKIINTLSDKELTFINSKYTSGYDKKPTSTFNSAEYIKLTSIIIKVKRRLSTYCTSKSFYEYINREKKVPREYIDILINKLSPNKKKELNDRFENGFDQPPTSIPNKSNIVIHNRIIIILRGRIFSLTTLNELINKDGKYTEQQIKIVLSVLSVKEKEFLIEIFGNELNNIQKPTSGKISQKLANITMKIRSLLKELEQTDEEQFLEKNGKNKRRKNRKNKRRKNRPFYELLGGNIVLINLLLEKQGQDRKSVVNKRFGNGLDKPPTISLNDEETKIYNSITQTIKSQIPNYPSNQLDEHNFYEQINQIITKPRSIDNLQRIIEHSLTEDEITIILKRYSYGLNNPPTTILDDDTYKEYINIVIKFKEGIKKSKSKSFHDEVDEERKYSNDEFNAALNSLTPLQKEAIIKVYGPDLGGSIPYKASQKDIHNCDNAITKVKKFLESGKGAMQAHGNNSRSRDFYYKETTTFLKQPPEIPLQDILEPLEASIIYHTCIERYSYEDLREILDMHEEAIQKIEENALGKLNDYIIAHNGIGEETEKDSKKVLQKKL